VSSRALYPAREVAANGGRRGKTKTARAGGGAGGRCVARARGRAPAVAVVGSCRAPAPPRIGRDGRRWNRPIGLTADRTVAACCGDRPEGDPDETPTRPCVSGSCEPWPGARPVVTARGPCGTLLVAPPASSQPCDGDSGARFPAGVGAPTAPRPKIPLQPVVCEQIRGVCCEPHAAVRSARPVPWSLSLQSRSRRFPTTTGRRSTALSHLPSRSGALVPSRFVRLDSILRICSPSRSRRSFMLPRHTARSHTSR